MRDHRKEDRMESFFLAETTKYLYLIFDPDNFIHNTGQHGTIINTPNGQCIIDTGGYIFNTEAHPIDAAALHCCSEVPTMKLFELNKLTSNKKLFQGDSLHTRQYNPPEKQPSSPSPPPLSSLSISSLPLSTPKSLEPKFVENTQDDTNIDMDVDTVETVKFVEQEKTEESSETIPTYFKPEDHDKIGTVTGVGSVVELSDNDNESHKELFKDIEDDYKLLPEFVNQFLTQSQNMRPKFDPQRMLERLRSDKRYARNSTWETGYQMLSCEAQPFLQKISLLGEFFDNS